MKRKHIILLILFSIGIKLGYLFFSVIINPNNSSKNLYNQYVSSVKKNDSYWFEWIAKNGYSKIHNKKDLGYSEGPIFKQSEWAFFPLYPMLNSITSDVLTIPFDFSALIWSLFFSTLSIIGLYWFGIFYYKNNAQSFFNTFILFCFPFSFYFSMFYTEALFFTFLIYSFICIYYRKYFILSILLALLTLIRPNGIIIIIPLYLYFLEQNSILKKHQIDWKMMFGKTNIIRTISFISAPLAFLAYGVYQYKMTGYFFAFSIAQDGWYREPTFPLLSFFRKGDFSTQFNSVYTIVAIVYSFFIWKKLPISLNILIWLSFLFPLCSGSVMSMSRFISVIFPIFLVLSLQIHKYYPKITVPILLILHFSSYYAWLLNFPISF
jgi:Gpi18-like mannosyltransferase